MNDIKGFEWNQGNIDKNWLKHEVSRAEAEEVFFNNPLLIHDDTKHSTKEQRYQALGKTNKNRKLFLAFTIRKQLIRVISARDMSKKERIEYERQEKNT